MLGYDDSLDVFGVHGIGGMVGALLTGVFAYGPLSATDAITRRQSGGLAQLWIQCQGVVATLVYSGVGTLILLMITKMLVGLRVSRTRSAKASTWFCTANRSSGRSVRARTGGVLFASALAGAPPGTGRQTMR